MEEEIRMEHKGLEALVSLDLDKVVELLGEQGTIELISDLIGGDCMSQDRVDEILCHLT